MQPTIVLSSSISQSRVLHPATSPTLSHLSSNANTTSSFTLPRASSRPRATGHSNSETLTKIPCSFSAFFLTLSAGANVSSMQTTFSMHCAVVKLDGGCRARCARSLCKRKCAQTRLVSGWNEVQGQAGVGLGVEGAGEGASESKRICVFWRDAGSGMASGSGSDSGVGVGVGADADCSGLLNKAAPRIYLYISY
jgi:hypothetical protein